MITLHAERAWLLNVTCALPSNENWKLPDKTLQKNYVLVNLVLLVSAKKKFGTTGNYYIVATNFQ